MRCSCQLQSLVVYGISMKQLLLCWVQMLSWPTLQPNLLSYWIPSFSLPTGQSFNIGVKRRPIKSMVRNHYPRKSPISWRNRLSWLTASIGCCHALLHLHPPQWQGFPWKKCLYSISSCQLFYLIMFITVHLAPDVKRGTGRKSRSCLSKFCHN